MMKFGYPERRVRDRAAWHFAHTGLVKMQVGRTKRGEGKNWTTQKKALRVRGCWTERGRTGRTRRTGQDRTDDGPGRTDRRTKTDRQTRHDKTDDSKTDGTGRTGRDGQDKTDDRPRQTTDQDGQRRPNRATHATKRVSGLPKE